MYLENSAKKPGVSAKLQPEYIGPFRLVKKTSDHSFIVENIKTGKKLRNPVHVDRMKAVRERKPFEKRKGPESEKGPPREIADTQTKSSDESESSPITPENTEQPQEFDQETVQLNWGIGNDVYQVERLLKVKGGPGKRQFLVKWKEGQGFEKNSWVNMEDISQSAIDAFYRTHTVAGKLRKEYQRKSQKK